MANNNKNNNATLDKIISLCKRRGFIYQTAEIYGGINGLYDMGPLGTLMKQNIKYFWQKALQKLDLEILFMDGSILSPQAVWEASGHIQGFQDPLVDCLNCKKRYREDEVNIEKVCPSCGILKWSEIRQFNLMFKTQVGAAEEQASIAILRPETAQSIFINFKNVMSTTRAKIPFGIGQIGKAFRNEINPKQFLFRMREFEQMELEWFCKKEDAIKFFDFWASERVEFYKNIGVDPNKIRLREYEKEELSHYSSATSDIEYKFPFGWKELEGVAYRSDYDLSQHIKFSGKDLSVYDDKTKESYVPHVVECSVGVDRLLLTLLFDAYTEENLDNETRVVLKLDPKVAPYKAAFLPLSKKQDQSMREIYRLIKTFGYSIQFDSTGSIGKRYRRQDEIGTPLCFTYDFDSEHDNCVTVRHRDTMSQERIKISEIKNYIEKTLNNS